MLDWINGKSIVSKKSEGTSMNQHEYFAVLTVDIIKSRLLSKSDLDAVRSSLLKAIDVAKRWKRGLVKGVFSLISGGRLL